MTGEDSGRGAVGASAVWIWRSSAGGLNNEIVGVFGCREAAMTAAKVDLVHASEVPAGWLRDGKLVWVEDNEGHLYTWDQTVDHWPVA